MAQSRQRKRTNPPESHRIAWLDEMVRRLKEDYRGWRRAGMSKEDAIKETLARSTAGKAAIAEFRRSIDREENGSKLEDQRAARERAGQIRKARLSRGPRFRDVSRGNPSLVDGIRHGDKVTILVPAGIGRGGQEWKKATGRAVMRGPSGWVLNMGGKYGRPGIATEENTVAVRSSNPSGEKIKKGESAPDFHKRRVKGILAKMPKAIRELFDRNPASYKFVFRNPDDQLSDAVDLYETFHGREPSEVLELQESAEQSGEYTGLGDLVELVIVAPNGDEVLIKFKDDGVRVGSSPDGGQLYFFGGNQDISEQLNLFGIKDTVKVLFDLGEAKRIVYEAAKWQTDFTAIEWKHDFGEESGVRPRAFFRGSRGENDPARIFLAGGNYKVERPGIVD